MAYSTKKVRVEKILVADGDAAFATAGTNVSALTTDGQLGVYDADTHLALDPATISAANNPRIYFAQGTGITTDNYPLKARPREVSPVLDSKNIVSFKGQSYTAPLNDVVLIGDTTANSGAINVADETVYELTIKFDGRRTDILNGRNQPAIFPQYETPDYSTDGPSTTELQRDDLVQNLVYNINKECIASRPSGSQIVALAINDGTTGASTAPGQTIADAIAGNEIILGYDDNTGAAITYTFNQAERDSIEDAVDAATTAGYNIADADEIVRVLISTPEAGTAAAAAVTAGTASVAGTDTNAQQILLVAVDESTAYYDRIAPVKTKIKVGLRQGFNAATVLNYRGSEASEGVGTGRQVELLYNETDELRKFDTAQAPGGNTFQYASPVDSTATYDGYTVEFYGDNQATNGIASQDPHVLYIFNEPGDTTTTADIEAALNNWMATLPFPKGPVNL